MNRKCRSIMNENKFYELRNKYPFTDVINKTIDSFNIFNILNSHLIYISNQIKSSSWQCLFIAECEFWLRCISIYKCKCTVWISHGMRVFLQNSMFSIKVRSCCHFRAKSCHKQQLFYLKIFTFKYSRDSFKIIFSFYHWEQTSNYGYDSALAFIAL